MDPTLERSLLINLIDELLLDRNDFNYTRSLSLTRRVSRANQIFFELDGVVYTGRCNRSAKCKWSFTGGTLTQPISVATIKLTRQAENESTIMRGNDKDPGPLYSLFDLGSAQLLVGGPDISNAPRVVLFKVDLEPTQYQVTVSAVELENEFTSAKDRQLVNWMHHHNFIPDDCMFGRCQLGSHQLWITYDFFVPRLYSVIDHDDQCEIIANREKQSYRLTYELDDA